MARLEARPQTRQADTAPPPPVAPFVSGQNEVPRSLDSVLLDAMAVQLTASLAQIAVPLAVTAKRFARKREWRNFGYRRVHDFARERLQRSGRWLQQWAQLGRGLRLFPDLGRAISGADGGPPIGKVAALEILRVAKPATLDMWIRRAREMTLREFQESIQLVVENAPDPTVITYKERLANYNDKLMPPLEPNDTPEGKPEDLGWELPQRSQITLRVPSAVRVAFDECLDLHRAVVGGHAPASAFVEALVAEAASGALPADAGRLPLRVPGCRTGREESMDALREERLGLELDGPSRSAVLHSMELLERLRKIHADPLPQDAAGLFDRLRTLCGVEDEIEHQIAETLLQMDRLSCWESMGFLDAAHYARVRLGMSRSTAEERLRIARSLRRLPVLRKAYEEGAIGVEAASIVRRILSRCAGARDVERKWVEHACRVTVKRLRDEARAPSSGLRRTVIRCRTLCFDFAWTTRWPTPF